MFILFFIILIICFLVKGYFEKKNRGELTTKQTSFLIMTLAITLLSSCVYTFYQNKKIENTNVIFNEKLNIIVSDNLNSFAGKCGHINNEDSYNEQYLNITLAKEAFDTLSGYIGISETWQYDLKGLFALIQYMMINDKEKYEEVFRREEVKDLLFKISMNLEDQKSIDEIYKFILPNR